MYFFTIPSSRRVRITNKIRPCGFIFFHKRKFKSRLKINKCIDLIIVMILLENDVYAINVTFSSIYDGRNNTFNEYELLLSIVTLYISGIRFRIFFYPLFAISCQIVSNIAIRYNRCHPSSSRWRATTICFFFLIDYSVGKNFVRPMLSSRRSYRNRQSYILKCMI